MPEAPGDAAFDCEDEAREALASAVASLSAASGAAGAFGPATLSLRWGRSGSSGFLAARLLPRRPAPDAEGVRWIALGRQAIGTVADEEDTSLHAEIFRHRADVAAVVSARPVFCTTLACLPPSRREGIPGFHADVAAAAGGAIRCAPQGPRGSPTRTDQVLDALQDRLGCLLGGRGLLAVGRTLPAVLARTAEIESLAQIYWQVLQATGGATAGATAGPAADPAAGAADERTTLAAEGRDR